MASKELYAVLAVMLVGGIGALVMFLRGLKRGTATGEARERAREAIEEIKEAVKRGDDAEVQDRLIDKIRGRK